MSLQEKSSKMVKVGSLDIHYNDVGSGPVILFIHGSGPGATGWSNFARNIEYFARENRVLAIDLPNYGGSTKLKIPPMVYSYYAEVILGFLDALNIPVATLVGNSLGGGISIKAALDQPKRIDRLVLMGAGGGFPIFTPLPSEGIKTVLEYYEAPGPTREKLRAFLDVMVYDSSALTDELIEQRFVSSTQPGISPLFTKTSTPGAESLVGRLGELVQPTLLIWGRDDRTVYLDNSFIMMKMIPDVRLHVFGKCGHWAQWEKADEFNELVEGFLKAVPA